MTIRVLYFASLREVLGTSGEELALPDGVSTVDALHRLLAGRGGDWAALGQTKNLRVALNQRMCEPGAALSDGDEVAFFPPVTGG